MQRRAHFLAKVGQNLGLDPFGGFRPAGLRGQPFLRVAGMAHERGGGQDGQDRQDAVADQVRKVGSRTGKKAPTTTSRQAMAVRIHRPAARL